MRFDFIKRIFRSSPSVAAPAAPVANAEQEGFYSCPALEVGGLHFGTNSAVHPCCNPKELPQPVLLRHDGNVFDIKEYLAAVEDLRERNNSANKPCAGCGRLQKRQWPSYGADFRIRQGITLNHYTICNLKCNYCGVFSESEPPAPIMSVMRSLFGSGMVDKQAALIIGGGEPALLGDLPELIELAMEYGNPVVINSNFVRYSPAISQLLRKPNKPPHVIRMSLDCGTPETYKNKRGKDAFADVVRNLSCYLQDASGTDNKVIVKYIVDVDNSQESEWRPFVRLIKELGVKHVHLNVESAKITKPEFSASLFKVQDSIRDALLEAVPNLDIFVLPNSQFVDLKIPTKGS